MTIIDSIIKHIKICMHCKGKNYLIKCECSPECHEVILRVGKDGKDRKLKKGHFYKGENVYNYKGRIFDGMYWRIIDPHHPQKSSKNRVYEHRVVMEQKIGRYLTKEEQVHHINGIKTDNRPENLMLFASNVEHKKYERTLDKSNRFCLLCNQKTYVRKNKKEMWYIHYNGFICDKCYNKQRYFKNRSEKINGTT